MKYHWNDSQRIKCHKPTKTKRMEKDMPASKRLSTNVWKLERDGWAVTNNRPEKAGSGSQHQADFVLPRVESLYEEQLDSRSTRPETTPPSSWQEMWGSLSAELWRCTKSGLKTLSHLSLLGSRMVAARLIPHLPRQKQERGEFLPGETDWRENTYRTDTWVPSIKIRHFTLLSYSDIHHAGNCPRPLRSSSHLLVLKFKQAAKSLPDI